MPDSVSHYRLLNKLGTGGMGTVYRARDSRTGETVALKLLHPHLAADTGYLRRFRREAQIARRLDSPHIVKVLDFGREGDAHFLVMEYVEGKTLAEVVQREGPLPIERTVSIASQMGEALAEGHRKGVVHRDLKPQNVILTREGQVKVADFGVARVTGQTTMTTTGMFLGTPQYMSPDHVGATVDIRSDLYSLGIVLYQMLTGAVPFSAETPWAVLRMHEDKKPPPVAKLRPEVPGWLQAVVERCLEKKPERRFQTPGELLAALAARVPVAADEGATVKVGSAAGGGTRVPPRRFVGLGLPGGRRFRLVSALGAGGLLIVLTVLGLALAGGMGGGNDGAESAGDGGMGGGDDGAQSAGKGEMSAPAVLAAETSTPAPPPLLSTPTPRPGGKIAFARDRAGNAEIYVMNADGSGQTRLTDNPAHDYWPAWSPDGTKIAFKRFGDGGGIYVMNADGSGQTRLTTRAEWPAWSPDGTKIAFTSYRDGKGNIYVMNADGSGQTRLTNSPANDISPAWSPDGTRIVFASDRDGDFEIYVMNADGSGQIRLTDNSAIDENPDWSPDGSKIAFHSDRDGYFGVYVMNADGSGQTRLTDNPGRGQGTGNPSWSPDGSQIAFNSPRQYFDDIYVMNADGSGQTRLTTGLVIDSDPAWSPVP